MYNHKLRDTIASLQTNSHDSTALTKAEELINEINNTNKIKLSDAELMLYSELCLITADYYVLNLNPFKALEILENPRLIETLRQLNFLSIKLSTPKLQKFEIIILQTSTLILYLKTITEEISFAEVNEKFEFLKKEIELPGRKVIVTPHSNKMLYHFYRCEAFLNYIFALASYRRSESKILSPEIAANHNNLAKQIVTQWITILESKLLEDSSANKRLS